MKLKCSTLLFLLLPLSVYCQDKNTIKVYGNGNTSLKINESKDTLSNTEKLTWLQNSALAFSNNEQELYFRHPTDNYYQVWNIARKQKTAEIPFSEAGNTAEGRKIMSSFHNFAYSKDDYIGSKIWISEDRTISFTKDDNFTISSPEKLLEHTFLINPRSYAFEGDFYDRTNFVKKIPLTNIKYRFNYHKKSNQLYIIITGDEISTNKKYNFGRYYFYYGVYRYNFTTGLVEELVENLDATYKPAQDFVYKDRFQFSGNSIVNFYMNFPDTKFREFSLESLDSKDLKYASKKQYNEYSTYGPINENWRLQYVGSDSSGNPYLCDPLNNAISVQKLDRKGQHGWGNVVYIRHDNRRINTVQPQREPETVLNVMAVSPSGNLIAYLNLYNHNDAGNTASIMLYNDGEKDRVYTFNDQTKYTPIIAKNYITTKESEELELGWNKQRNYAKDKRLALYKGRIDSLKAKIAEADSMITATYQYDIDLAAQHKYNEILAGKEWLGYYTETQNITYRKGQPREFVVTANFYINETLSFINEGNLISAVYTESLVMPGGITNADGEYILKDNGGSSNGYSPSVSLRTNCRSLLSDFDGNRILTKPGFKLNNAFGDCTEPLGKKELELSSIYQEFAKEYLGFLMGCKFDIGKTTGTVSPIVLIATGKNGTKITFDYVKTTLQRQLKDRKDNLKMQLNDLEKFIEKGS